MAHFENKTLLITGGTGSFGNAVLNRILSTDIGEIRILSRDEKKQDDMRHEYQAKMPAVSGKIKFYIGDVRDYNSIVSAFRGVDYVFHAAALKQVPSCEFYPMEAVKTNIQGSDNVISACVENHVQKAIFLSTDKAAYPINAMGMTKAVMEKDVIARSRQMLPGDPILCLTRYGNVMGSRGSVIPLFCEQIDEGKQLTITNPEMTRFMMTLNDAVDLVLYAFEHTEKYLSGISIFVVYILVDIMQFTNITLILSASGKTKTLMLLSGGSIVLNIGMNFLLFHLLGVIGPAIATLLITSLTGAAILYFSAKKLGTRITGFFDFRYLIRLLAENIAAVTVLACLRNLLESAGLNNLLILLLICGTYYVILLALNKKRLIVNLKEIG